MSIRKQLVKSLLDDRSHHIEFNGHLSNHNKHAVIALERLGAANERIKGYYDGYAECTPYGYGLEPARGSKYEITSKNWKQYLGKRTSYSSYYDFFAAEEKCLGMDELLKKYAPFLMQGWASALTHAAIHLGWALDINNKTMILEGLAYLAFSYISCHPERALKAQEDSLCNESAFLSMLSLAEVWEDSKPKLQNWATNLANVENYDPSQGINPELVRSGLQYRVAKMLETGHELIYALPAWLDADISCVWKNINEVVTLIYLNEPGDFLLLHFITAAHGVREIAERMPLSDQYNMAKNFWIGLLCILFSQGEFPSPDSLKRVYEEFHGVSDEEGGESVSIFWKEVIAQAIEEEEEHNPKMVYALKNMWQLSGYKSLFRQAAAKFTTTPELPQSFARPIIID